MTPHEERLLAALSWMCRQYIADGDDWLDHQCISAGELAVELLIEHGLVEPSGRGGSWTEKGKAFLQAH